MYMKKNYKTQGKQIWWWFLQILVVDGGLCKYGIGFMGFAIVFGYKKEKEEKTVQEQRLSKKGSGW